MFTNISATCNIQVMIFNLFLTLVPYHIIREHVMGFGENVSNCTSGKITSG